MLTVEVGGILAAGVALAGDHTLLAASLSAGLVAAGGNAVNDAFDVETDRLNRPRRPIPSGQISVSAARWWSALLMLSGVILGFSLDAALGVIALLVSGLLLGYSAGLKGTPLWGNVTVALCGGLAFVYGATAVGSIKHGIIPALFAFLIHTSREIVKDVEDAAGDRIVGARTAPIVWGQKKALQVSSLALFILILTTPVPYILGSLNAIYMTTVVLTVDIPLALIIGYTLRSGERVDAGRLSLYLKLIMLTGLVSLYVGSIGNS